MSRKGWQNQFPCMPNSKKYWIIFRDFPSECIQVELYYVHWKLHNKEDGYFIEQMEDLVNRTREVRFKMENYKTHAPAFAAMSTEAQICKPVFSFGNCEAATPYVDLPREVLPYQKQQGNNPMREYNSISTATAVVTQKSDEAFQREYLLEQFQEIKHQRNWSDDSKYQELRKLFNIDAPTKPQTAKALLDAFQNGKFTVDQKKIDLNEKWSAGERNSCEDDYDDGDIYSIFFGITFTDLPKADKEGFDAAVKSYEEAVKNTERKIIVASPADGLQALVDLEAWLPTGKAN